MTSLAGTGSLLRLALRRDRVKLPGWIAAIALLTWVQAVGIDGVYPEPADRIAYATTTASNAAARLFGAVDGPALGSIMMNELYVSLSVVVALLCSMLVVRHTRQNEETGRLELVRSTEVGRHASLAAALLLAIVTCATVAVAMLAVLVGIGLPVAGSLLMAGSIAGVGLAFAGVAAVASQVAGGARTANGLVGIVLAVAFVLRAAGDVGGTVSSDGMRVLISWPSWLSPIGWGQLAYPFGEQRAWVLGLYAVAFVAGAVLAVVLSARRDFGRGMLPERRASPRAGRALSGPFGLAVRLHRTAIVAWTIGLLLFGVIGGVFAGAIDDLFAGNETALEVFASLGGTEVLVDSYYATMNAYLALMATGMALQVAMRLRSEERGPGESVLAAGAGRAAWMASHLVVSVVATAVALVAAAGVMELFSAAVGEPVDRFVLVGGALAQVPAVLVFVGAVALGFGAMPRLAGWFGWGLYGVAVVVLIVSALDPPEWVLRVSPFEHVPMVPVEQVEAGPLVALSAIALAAAAIGVLRFRGRDIDASA